MGAILKLVFGISEVETTCARRGFHADGAMREHIEKIGRTFVAGYHTALNDRREEILVARLNEVEHEYRGFAYEGAAMALGVLDRVTPWKRDRLRSFLRGAGDAHAYMLHVALGWVIARTPGGFAKLLEELDPLLRWLVIDGYGFHEGFFNWHKYDGGQSAPTRLTGYAKRAFDQGLGRSLWFREGGDPAGIRSAINRFAVTRRADLWSGVGLAAVCAGVVAEAQLHSLLHASGEFQPQLSQGASFAAKARHRAGNANAYTHGACWILCGMSSADAAAVTDATLENLPANAIEPAFEIWRQRIQSRFSQRKELK